MKFPTQKSKRLQFDKTQNQQRCGETGSPSLVRMKTGTLPFKEGILAIHIKMKNVQPFHLVYQIGFFGERTNKSYIVMQKGLL